MSEIEKYCQQDMDFLFPRLSNDAKRIFIIIMNYYVKNNEGVNWKTIIDKENDRFKVERALFLLTTLGFVTYEISLNMRNKRYVPHKTRGQQLAEYLKRDQMNSSN